MRIFFWGPYTNRWWRRDENDVFDPVVGSRLYSRLYSRLNLLIMGAPDDVVW